jgi:hypothetical protein
MKQRSPATVVAVLALVVALCGSSLAGYAAGKANGDSIVKKRSLSGNRLKADTVTGKQVEESTLGAVPLASRASRADTVPVATFHPLVLVEFQPYTVNGYRAPGWRKDVSGFVHLEGHVTSESGEIIAQLPVGARPTGRLNFTVPDGSGDPATVALGSDGKLGLGAGTPFNLSLDAISYYAGP